MNIKTLLTILPKIFSWHFEFIKTIRFMTSNTFLAYKRSNS